LADVAALDLRWDSGPDSAALVELLYATLDEFEPQAIHDVESADGWRVFFKTSPQRDAAAAALRVSFGDRLLALSIAEVPDEEWARRSQAHLTPIRVGRIVVSPPWHAAPYPSSYILEPVPLGIEHSPDLVIVIDPSTGFGTGHHETTRLCLSLLQSFELAGRGVIDVGTGSGVLAIAAAKLGASSVVAFDEDPEALRNARENVARNDVSSLVDVQEAELGTFRGNAADVVVANLTGAVIQKHAGRLAALVAPGGRLIVSGFSASETPDVARSLGHTTEREVAEGDWAAITFQRPPDSLRT
jgi:ribosomal protein L11 methyltransferase